MESNFEIMKTKFGETSGKIFEKLKKPGNRKLIYSVIILTTVLVIIVLSIVYLSKSNKIVNVTQGKCFYSNQSKWSVFTKGHVTNIFVYNNTIYGVGVNHIVWYIDIESSNLNWTKMKETCCVKNICILNDSLYGIAIDNYLYVKNLKQGKWYRTKTNIKFEQLTTNGQILLALGKDGLIYFVDLNGDVQRFYKNCVQYTYILSYGHFVYAIATDMSLHRCVAHIDAVWKQICPGKIKCFTVTQQGIFAISVNGDLVATFYNGGDWKILDKTLKLTYITSIDNALYGISRQQVFMKDVNTNYLIDN